MNRFQFLTKMALSESGGNELANMQMEANRITDEVTIFFWIFFNGSVKVTTLFICIIFVPCGSRIISPVS